MWATIDDTSKRVCDAKAKPRVAIVQGYVREKPQVLHSDGRGIVGSSKGA